MEDRKKLLILYDGNCALCCAKKEFLIRRDHKNKLAFADIHSDDFLKLKIPISQDALEKEIHCLMPDGQILKAMDVIRAAYIKIGIGWLAKPTGWPLLHPVFDWLYQWLARNRLKINRFF